MGSLFIAFAFWIFSETSVAGTANVSKEVLRLERCYGLIVRERIPLTDPLRVAVLNGTKSGTDACMSLFDRAQLDSNGELPKVNGAPDPIGAKILSNMVKVSQGWLMGTQDPKPVMGNSMDVFDSNEPAYNWAYVLLRKDEAFSKLVTRSQGIRAIRSTSRTGRRTVSLGASNLNFTQGSSDITPPNNAPFNPPLVETGTLVGLKEDTLVIPVGAGKNPLLYTTGENWRDHNINRHFGGGFIGSQTYLFLNNNKQGPADGGAQTFRVWSRSVFSDAFCKSLPVLRTVDATLHLNSNSSLPWRQGISCMGCHASIDYLAGGIRNLQKIPSSTETEPVLFWTTWSTKEARSPEGVTPILNGEPTHYKFRPVEGTLRFRTYDGKLVELDFNGLNELGSLIANQDDLYACAAKRYFGFLTGIEVNLADAGDPMQPLGLNAAEMNYRNRVIELGAALKKSQNLRNLVRSVIESDTFINPDRGI